jgi:hypothetical protein
MDSPKAKARDRGRGYEGFQPVALVGCTIVDLCTCICICILIRCVVVTHSLLLVICCVYDRDVIEMLSRYTDDSSSLYEMSIAS